jgi:PH (Pleckstrin Homology) domain-containing protein
MEEIVPATMRARPRRARLACWVAAAIVVVVSVLLAGGLRGQVTAGGGTVQTADQVAMVGLGVLAALAILVFTRPRVEADAAGVRVRNLVGSYDLPWAVVRAVRFGRGMPWVVLELEDDDAVAVMAVQVADKQYAVEAVRQLRALHAAHHPGGPAAPVQP